MTDFSSVYSSTAAILGLAAREGTARSPHDVWNMAGRSGSPALSIELAGTRHLVSVSPVESVAAAKPFVPLEDIYLPHVVRLGLPFMCAQNVAAVLEVPMARLYALIDMSATTAHRRQKERLLSEAESDRLARIARVTADAIRVFGDIETAKRWLGRKHVVLGSAAPLDLLDTDSGTEQVIDELTRIEFGELAA